MAKLITRADSADISQTPQDTAQVQRLYDATLSARQIVAIYGEGFRPILTRLEFGLSKLFGVDVQGDNLGLEGPTHIPVASYEVCAAVLGTVPVVERSPWKMTQPPSKLILMNAPCLM